jgi:hypothetical protein
MPFKEIFNGLMPSSADFYEAKLNFNFFRLSVR